MSFSKRFCAKNPFKPSPLRTESQEAKPVTKKVSSSDWTKEAEEQAHNRNKYTTDIIIDDKYIYIHYIYILKIK